MTVRTRVEKLENEGNIKPPPCTCPSQEALDSMTRVSPEEANRIYFQRVNCGAHSGKHLPPSRHSTGDLQMTPEEVEQYYHEFRTLTGRFAPGNSN